MKRLENIGDKLIPTVFIGILISLWYFATERGFVEKYVLPSPKDVGLTFFKILPDLKPHIIVTLKEAFLGLLLAIFIAIILAVLMDNVKIVKKTIYPLLIISQTVPIIILAPLFAIWFGFGILPKIIVVMIVCFFPIAISLTEGLESVDEDIINLMRSMGAGRLKIFTLVKFPATMGTFFSGLKVAATYSIMGAIIGEWMGGKVGLGLYMMRAKKSFALEKVFVVIILIIILSILIFKIVSALQYLLMPWARDKENRRKDYEKTRNIIFRSRTFIRFFNWVSR